MQQLNESSMKHFLKLYFLRFLILLSVSTFATTSFSQSVTLSGCDSGSVGGEYTFNGNTNGRPSFINSAGDIDILWTGKEWIVTDGFTLLSNNADTPNPPSTGWVVQDGLGDGCSVTFNPACPTFTTSAPVAVVSSESTCTVFGGTPAGGAIAAPATNCPDGSALMYSIDGTNFSANLPIYNQFVPVTVTTRCDCEADGSVVSRASQVATNPGACPDTVPTMSEWGLMIFGLLILNMGVMFLYRREDLLAGI